MDDIEFNSCLFSYMHSNNINADIIRNTQQLQLCSKRSLCSKDIDPDNYLLNQAEISSDRYYLEDTFCNLVKQQVTKNAFSVIHLNIRSLSKNLDNFLAYLSQLPHKFSVIAFSETWATESNENSFKIPGYNNIFKSRTTSTGGGIALYVLDRLSYEIRKDCTFSKNLLLIRSLSILMGLTQQKQLLELYIDHLIPTPNSIYRIFKKLLKP